MAHYHKHRISAAINGQFRHNGDWFALWHSIVFVGGANWLSVNGLLFSQGFHWPRVFCGWASRRAEKGRMGPESHLTFSGGKDVPRGAYPSTFRGNHVDTDFSSDLSLINSFNKQVIVQAFQHERPIPTLISGARQIVWLIDEIACLGENREDPHENFQRIGPRCCSLASKCLLEEIERFPKLKGCFPYSKISQIEKIFQIMISCALTENTTSKSGWCIDHFDARQACEILVKRFRLILLHNFCVLERAGFAQTRLAIRNEPPIVKKPSYGFHHEVPD